MKFAEEQLSTFRDRHGYLSTRRMPDDMFTFSENIFIDDWPKISGMRSRDKMEIVTLLAFTDTVPPLAAGHQWLAIEHYGGGSERNLYKLIAIQLKPRPEIYAALRQIAHNRLFKVIRPYEQTASEICTYCHDLSVLGLHCELTWRLLTESLYPIDATPENLEKVALDAPCLNDLVVGEWRCRYGEGPAIIVLAQNSD